MNYQLFELINGAAGRHDGVDDLMELGATWLIYPMFAVAAVAAVLAGLALYRRRLQPVIELGVTLFLAFAASSILAHVSTEVRPFQTHPVHQLIAHEAGASLPSNHATAAFALAVGVGLFLHHGWGWTLAVAAVRSDPGGNPVAGVQAPTAFLDVGVRHEADQYSQQDQ